MMLRAERHQSRVEELANSASHGIGFVLALILLPMLVRLSIARGEAALHTVAVSVFAAATLLLYLSSALFHGLPSGRAKRFFDKLDRAAIYVFIAASYSPFAASAMNGSRGALMLTLVWVMALAGLVITFRNLVTNPLWSTALYVGMGWLVLVAAIPWIERAPVFGVRLLVSGCLIYTLGAACFLLGARVRFAHLAWHLCVMAGGGLHLAAMMLPR